MIRDIIDLLTLEEYYGVSRRVDVAKGKYTIPVSYKDFWKQVKRIWNGR